MKLYEAGKLNKTIITFLEKNVRVPVMVLGDLRAQLAACHIAEKQFAELVARHGPAQTKQYLERDHRLLRAPDAGRAARPAGRRVELRGLDRRRRRRCRQADPPVRHHPQAGRPHGRRLDRHQPAGASGAINNTLSYTKSASYTGIRSVLPNNIPNNEGVFRAIEVICPPGTVGNGVLPAACAARGLTGFRMVDCMFGALAMMLPDKVKAAGDGGNSGISIGGYDADRKPFVYVEFTCGAWGARPWADGLNGNSHMFANMSCPRPRSSRPSSRSQCCAYEFVSDKAGAGKYRGGVPFRRVYRLNEARGDAVGALRPPDASARSASTAAAPACRRELPEPARREPAAAVKVTMQMKRGDVFCHVIPAAAAGAIRWSAIRQPC